MTESSHGRYAIFALLLLFEFSGLKRCRSTQMQIDRHAPNGWVFCCGFSYLLSETSEISELDLMVIKYYVELLGRKWRYLQVQFRLITGSCWSWVGYNFWKAMCVSLMLMLERNEDDVVGLRKLSCKLLMETIIWMGLSLLTLKNTVQSTWEGLINEVGYDLIWGLSIKEES